MSIRVLFFASLAEITGSREKTVDAAAVSDVASVFDRFAREFPALESYRSSVLFALNSEFARLGSPVRDGDEIAFFPPVSGG
jgi:molybdopterin synthase sulfur carrier subunit